MMKLWTTPPIEDHTLWAYHMDRHPYTVYLSRQPCHGWELWVDPVSKKNIVIWVVRPLTDESKSALETVPPPEIIPGGTGKLGKSSTEADALDVAEQHVWEVGFPRNLGGMLLEERELCLRHEEGSIRSSASARFGS